MRLSSWDMTAQTFTAHEISKAGSDARRDGQDGRKMHTGNPNMDEQPVMACHHILHSLSGSVQLE